MQWACTIISWLAEACKTLLLLQAMQRLMRDHGKEDASPRNELKALLASGSLSPAMHQFLTSTLGWYLHILDDWDLFMSLHL